MYRTDVYFLCKTLAEAPIFIAVPLLFTIIAYPMIGLYPGIDHFFITASIVALVANVSTSFGTLFVIHVCTILSYLSNLSNTYITEKYIFFLGYLISCISNNLSMALSIGPPVIIPFLLFGGFFLNTA